MDIVDSIRKKDQEKQFINSFSNSEFSIDDMEDDFEKIMNSNCIPAELNQRISTEDLVNEKIDIIKAAIKSATEMELEFLNNNFDYVIEILMNNSRIKKDYEYHKELKRIY